MKKENNRTIPAVNLPQYVSYKKTYFEACKSNHVNVVRALLDTGIVSVLATTLGEETTGLSVASQHGSVDVAKLLLELNADPNETDYYGWSPLMFAVDNGNVAIVNLLVKANADLNIASYDKMTALIIAMLNNNIEIMTILLRATVIRPTITFNLWTQWSTLSIPTISTPGCMEIPNSMYKIVSSTEPNDYCAFCVAVMAVKNTNHSIVNKNITSTSLFHLSTSILRKVAGMLKYKKLEPLDFVKVMNNPCFNTS